MNDSSAPLDLLFVGTLPPHPGGTAIVAVDMVEGLADAGHSIRTISPLASSLKEDPYTPEHPSISVYRFPVPYFETSPDIPPPDSYRQWEGSRIAQEFHRLVDSRRPDLVIIGRETFAWHVPDLAITYAIPTVLQLHGGTSLGIFHKTFPRVMRKALLRQFRKVDAMTAVARHLAEKIAALGFECEAIPNPVDLRKFRPREKDSELLRKFQITPDDTVILHASNMKRVKQVDHMIESATEVLQQEKKVVYLVVGDGPGLTNLRKIVKEKRLSKYVRFGGWVEHREMPLFYSLADVVLMPSAFEAQALVYLEAQASGKVVLASDIDGAREVITDGKSGILFPHGNIERLIAKTLYMIRRPDIRRRVGREARKRVAEHDLQKIIPLYSRYFRRVVDGKVGTAGPDNASKG